MTPMMIALVYGTPLVLILGTYLLMRGRATKRASAILNESVEAGLTEPASLHPHIDYALCCGAGACVAACPEKTVIGIIKGKAALVDPTACIGHGACAAACPTNAIELVFGSQTRGVDLPVVSPEFETNIPGLYIAGELGGMGLIRNAITQGRQAVEAIARNRPPAHDGILDLLIVGAGPAGLAASLGAKAEGFNYLTIEQESFGGTVAHFPRGKVVMTEQVELPLVGKVNFREVSKEDLLGFWGQIRETHDLNISFEHPFDGLEETAEGFRVATGKGPIEARTVLLTIGRRGTPRKLGVPGEDMPKVVYRLSDPAQFAGSKVLVVGGGDSALEAAATLADETTATVTLSYRGDAFQRARRKNRARVEALAATDKLKVLLKSNVLEIGEANIRLGTEDSEADLPNDHVIVCAGGILPTGLLKDMGVEIVRKYGEP